MVRQMVDHTLEIIKGLTPTSLYTLDYFAEFDATQRDTITGGYIPAGRCVSLKSNGKFQLGVDAQTIPFFLASNSDDPDVRNDGGDPESDPNAFAPGSPSEKLRAYCALGNFEFETTEFISTLSYALNEPLTAPLQSTGTAADLKNTAGKLTNASVKPYGSNVVGWVSKAYTANAKNNAHSKPSLRFYPDFLPAIGDGVTEPTWAA